MLDLLWLQSRKGEVTLQRYLYFIDTVITVLLLHYYFSWEIWNSKEKGGHALITTFSNHGWLICGSIWHSIWHTCKWRMVVRTKPLTLRFTPASLHCGWSGISIVYFISLSILLLLLLLKDARVSPTMCSRLFFLFWFYQMFK